LIENMSFCNSVRALERHMQVQNIPHIQQIP